MHNWLVQKSISLKYKGDEDGVPVMEKKRKLWKIIQIKKLLFIEIVHVFTTLSIKQKNI